METTFSTFSENDTEKYGMEVKVVFPNCKNLIIPADSDFVYELWKCELHNDLEFIFNGVGLTLICSIGCVLNILSVAVLLQKKMRIIPINTLLLGLQISDFFAVFSLLVSVGIPTVVDWIHPDQGANTIYDNIWTLLIERYAYNWPLICSYYFTVVITIERYVAVCHPLRASLFTTNRAKLWCLFVGMFSALTAAPFYINYWVIYDYEKEKYVIQGTGFEKTKFYQFYLSYGDMILFYVLPISALLILNLLIHSQIRRANTQRALMREAQGQPGSTSSSPNNSLTFLCSSVAWIYLGVLPITEMFVGLNSSANFIFYCIFGENFRIEIVNLFKNICIWKKRCIICCEQQTIKFKTHRYASATTTSTITSTQTLDTEV